MTQLTIGASVERNKVLRNTFALLGISMIPTVLGAIIGVMTHFSFTGNSLYDGLIYLVGMIGLIFAIAYNRDNGFGVALLLGFTFLMGLMMNKMLLSALGHNNGGQMIAVAAGGTGLIFFAMTALAMSGRDFSKLGNFLYAGLILLVLAGIANLFFQIPALHIALAAVGVVLFTGYILYDVNQVVIGGETNYIMATLNIYLDLMNLFVDLLRLLMAFSGDSD